MVCLDGVALELHWVRLTHITPSSFHTASLLHLLPSTSIPPSLSLGHAPSLDAVWLSAGGHTHWLIQLGDGSISVAAKIISGLPLVGLLDVSSANEGGVVDVRLEGDEKGAGMEVILNYYNKDGLKEGGGVYTLVQPRGRPVLVGMWCVYMRDDNYVFFL